MIKFCLEKWDKNKELLKEHLKSRTDLNTCEYKLLVELVVIYIFNDGKLSDYTDYGAHNLYNCNEITEIDNGDYQGTLLYLIPKCTYQPCESEYLMTYVDYGSCSGCDTLQAIQEWEKDKKLTGKQLEDFMTLCKDIVQNTIKPYNVGWRYDEIYEPVEETKK